MLSQTLQNFILFCYTIIVYFIALFLNQFFLNVFYQMQDNNVFPKRTCEKVSQDLAFKQPWSTIAGIITSIMILYFLINAKTREQFILISTLLIFELFHTYSHSTHWPGTTQVSCMHLISVFVNIVIIYVFSSLSKSWPSAIFIAWILGILVFDIYAFLNLPLYFYVGSQFVFMISIFIYYWGLFKESAKKWIPWIVLAMAIIIGLEINEIYNCQSMMHWAPSFPFHILIDGVGLLAIYMIIQLFINLGAKS
jgi:hypothetical protein